MLDSNNKSVNMDRRSRNEFPATCRTNRKTLMPKTILHILPQGKKGKRKSNEKMEIPVPGKLYWSQKSNKSNPLIDYNRVIPVLFLFYTKMN